MRTTFKTKVTAAIAALMITLTGAAAMTPADAGDSSILGSVTLTADAADVISRDQAVKWANERAREAWSEDVDHSYGTQCVDLAMKYYRYLVGYNVGGNATDYQTNKLPKGWTRTRTPQPGDLIVWGGNTKINANCRLSKYGHIGIVVAVNSKKGTVTTVETRGGSGVAAHKYTREIKYATVFIRPSFGKETSVTTDTLVNFGTYIIYSADNDSVCVGATGTTNKSNVKCVKADKKNKLNQWKAVGNGNSWKFYNVSSGKVMDICTNNVANIKNTTNIHVYSSQTKKALSATQTFKPVITKVNGNVYYRFAVSGNTSFVLDCAGESASTSSNVRLYKAAGKTNNTQNFILRRIS